MSGFKLLGNISRLKQLLSSAPACADEVIKARAFASLAQEGSAAEIFDRYSYHMAIITKDSLL